MGKEETPWDGDEAEGKEELRLVGKLTLVFTPEYGEERTLTVERSEVGGLEYTSTDMNLAPQDLCAASLMLSAGLATVLCELNIQSRM